jgi:hypothetical protein
MKIEAVLSTEPGLIAVVLSAKFKRTRRVPFRLRTSAVRHSDRRTGQAPHGTAREPYGAVIAYYHKHNKAPSNGLACCAL